MSEALSTFEPTTSEATPRPISLPASAAGRSPSDSPGGPTSDLFGAAAAPASPSHPPERARRAMTNATCGLRGHLSSPSAALEQSLVNKLKRRLDGAGSTLFSLIWKRKATPAGRPYYQLAASARRTSATEFGSWPTPNHNSTGAGHEGRDGGFNLQTAAQLASWPTPMAGTPAQKGYNEAGNTDASRKTVALASWPTPRVAADRTSTTAMDRQDSMSALSLEQVSETAAGLIPREIEKLRPEMRARLGFAAWSTPTQQDQASSGAAGYSTESGRHSGTTLTDAANLAAWPTPNAMEGGQTSRSGKRKDEKLMGGLVSGPTPSGSPAPTEKPGQLNPELSRWLMGYSAAHLSCAPTAMPSSRKSRLRS
jgi:hypothetical protein